MALTHNKGITAVSPHVRNHSVCRAAAFALIVLLAPNEPAVARSPESVVNAYLKAMARKDRAAIAALISDDVVFEYPFDRSGRTEAGTWRVFTGRNAVMFGYVDGAFKRIARISFVDREATVSADGKRVFVEALGDMDLAGIPYRNRYLLRFDLRNGRIAHMKEYLNPVTGAIAAGVTTGAERQQK